MYLSIMSCRKRRRCSGKPQQEEEEEEVEVVKGGEGLNDPFEELPDDLVMCVLSKLCQSASSPSDFINALIVCKRFNRLGMNRLVLSRAESKMFSIRAKNWSESSHRFVKHCVNAGSVEACYFLGMVRFYCLEKRGNGASLLAKAATRSHAPSLYALSVIQFNGSGGASKSDKDLTAGVALCARAAFLGHVDALRELGHCLQDGYGVRRNVPEGRRLLVQANARELAASVLPTSSPSSSSSSMASSSPAPPPAPLPPRHKVRWRSSTPRRQQKRRQAMDMGLSGGVVGSALLSDFGCTLPAKEPHPANRFLVEWFEGKLSDTELRMCSHSGCGRPETRAHEFRRCSVCGKVNYCSRGCQAHDWKMRHKWECLPAAVLAEHWQGGGMEAANGGGGLANDEEMVES